MPTEVHTSLSSVRMWLERKMVLPSSLQLEQQVAHLDARARVEVARGLVQDQHLGIVQQDARDLQALLHALAERRHQAIVAA